MKTFKVKYMTGFFKFETRTVTSLDKVRALRMAKDFCSVQDFILVSVKEVS